MKIKIITLVALFTGIIAFDYRCSERSALLLLKRPAYEFSIKLLQRVAIDTDAHFVYSPLSTWLQLTALAEGAKGNTLREIWKVTRHHRNRCFRRKLRQIFFKLDKDLRSDSKRKSLMVLDSFMGIKSSFVRDVQKLYGITVMLLNFDKPANSAEKVNRVIQKGTDGVVSRAVYYDDFMSTVLLMSDASYFRSEWKSPFNRVYTELQPFYKKGIKIGTVSMMNQIGYFNVTDIPLINATVLELPCAKSRVSMLVFLPMNNFWVGELFLNLQKTGLTSIFNMYKSEGPKIVNVTLPRFKIRSEIDNLPELISDMGVKRVFNRNTAELDGISSYKMYTSLMTQITDIEVTEKGVAANVAPHLLINKGNSVEFAANRPFAYMIVDRYTEFILYAGTYSMPNVY